MDLSDNDIIDLCDSVSDLNSRVESYEGENKKLQQQIKVAAGEISTYKALLEEKEKYILELEDSIFLMDEEMAQLKIENQKLNAENDVLSLDEIKENCETPSLLVGSQPSMKKFNDTACQTTGNHLQHSDMLAALNRLEDEVDHLSLELTQAKETIDVKDKEIALMKKKIEELQFLSSLGKPDSIKLQLIDDSSARDSFDDEYEHLRGSSLPTSNVSNRDTSSSASSGSLMLGRFSRFRDLDSDYSSTNFMSNSRVAIMPPLPPLPPSPSSLDSHLIPVSNSSRRHSFGSSKKKINDAISMNRNSINVDPNCTSPLEKPSMMTSEHGSDPSGFISSSFSYSCSNNSSGINSGNNNNNSSGSNSSSSNSYCNSSNINANSTTTSSSSSNGMSIKLKDFLSPSKVEGSFRDRKQISSPPESPSSLIAIPKKISSLSPEVDSSSNSTPMKRIFTRPLPVEPLINRIFVHRSNQVQNFSEEGEECPKNS